MNINALKSILVFHSVCHPEGSQPKSNPPNSALIGVGSLQSCGKRMVGNYRIFS